MCLFLWRLRLLLACCFVALYAHVTVAQSSKLFESWTKHQLSHGQISQKQANTRLSTLALTVPHFISQIRTNKNHFGGRKLSSQEGCHQAWVGPGTGAWYRIDTLCNSSNWQQTSVRYCFPRIVNLASKDGVYVSLGVYNTQTGAGADVGFTFDERSQSWCLYAASEKGWVSGSIAIPKTLYPCVDVLVSMVEIDSRQISYNQLGNNTANIQVVATDSASGKTIGIDIIHGEALDPSLMLNPLGTNIGYYRFDSIAQPAPETLASGTVFENSETLLWSVFNRTFSTLVVEEFVAKSNRGFPAGPCCSEREKKTITVQSQIAYHSSIISIRYTNHSLPQ